MRFLREETAEVVRQGNLSVLPEGKVSGGYGLQPDSCGFGKDTEEGCGYIENLRAGGGRTCCGGTEESGF